MAEPRLRFKRDDGSSYPAWKEYALADIMTERNEPHLITADAPQLSFTIEQGVIYPEDKKSNVTVKIKTTTNISNTTNKPIITYSILPPSSL